MSQRQRVRASPCPQTLPLGAPSALDLFDERTLDEALTGAKAARLARAANSGLPVLTGFVLTTQGAERIAAGDRALTTQLAALWRSYSAGGKHRVVVRSSSTAEDLENSSMAGHFTSVTGVQSWADFHRAVMTVLASGGGSPMAVLVQRQIDPVVSGVLFGADPVTGDRSRLVVSAVAGAPHQLVGGEVTGTHSVLSKRGRTIRSDGEAVPLTRSRRIALARLAARVEELFGGPQDVEWGVDADRTLWLLQSRPITATAQASPAQGPVFGPHPVAETFPEPLSTLEQDLWLQPLTEGLRNALSISASVSRRKLRKSPIVITVDGWAAADLALLGMQPGKRSVLARLDPRPALRRLGASWSVGRLRAALPELADDLLKTTDEDLGSVPALERLDDEALLALLEQTRTALVALHGHEVLAGMLLQQDNPITAASVALQALVAARAEGLDDEAVVGRAPVVLALVAPAIRGGPISLPPSPAGTIAPPRRDQAPIREELRLRARWVQELSARAVQELGGRLVKRGVLSSSDVVRDFDLEGLGFMVARGVRTRPTAPQGRGAPLPAAFRLASDGSVVPLTADASSAGIGAGGGRAFGPAHLGSTPNPGDVLVVATLEPGLAALLPGLAGLVAETGSVLSHLAILAREQGIPTVVGFVGAREAFAEGEKIIVDGTTGEVSLVEDGA